MIACIIVITTSTFARYQLSLSTSEEIVFVFFSVCVCVCFRYFMVFTVISMDLYFSVSYQQSLGCIWWPNKPSYSLSRYEKRWRTLQLLLHQKSQIIQIMLTYFIYEFKRIMKTINTINQLAKTIINCGWKYNKSSENTQNHNLIKSDIKLLVISISNGLIYLCMFIV